jgi:hypothetical protein
MLPPDPDRVITLVQSSTKNIMNSFRGKTELLRQCHKDIKLLIREDYDRKIAYESALRFFGKNRAKFIAIDGTKSQDQELDVLVFYAGAFGYIGQLEFSDDGTILYVSETQLKWYFTVYSNRKDNTYHISKGTSMVVQKQGDKWKRGSDVVEEQKRGAWLTDV